MCSHPCCLIFSPFLFKSKLQPQAFLAQLRPPVILFLEIPVLRPKRISSDEKYDYHLLFPSRKIFSFCPPPPPTHPILSTHQTQFWLFLPSLRGHIRSLGCLHMEATKRKARTGGSLAGLWPALMPYLSWNSSVKQNERYGQLTLVNSTSADTGEFSCWGQLCNGYICRRDETRAGSTYIFFTGISLVHDGNSLNC